MCIYNMSNFINGYIDLSAVNLETSVLNVLNSTTLFGPTNMIGDVSANKIISQEIISQEIISRDISSNNVIVNNLNVLGSFILAPSIQATIDISTNAIVTNAINNSLLISTTLMICLTQTKATIQNLTKQQVESIPGQYLGLININPLNNPPNQTILSLLSNAQTENLLPTQLSYLQINYINSSYNQGPNNTSGNHMFQSFITPMTGILTTITVYYGTAINNSIDGSFNIYSGLGSESIPLLSQNISLTTSYNNNNINIQNNFRVYAGKEYTFELILPPGPNYSFGSASPQYGLFWTNILGLNPGYSLWFQMSIGVPPG